jgi:hypothetical protein
MRILAALLCVGLAGCIHVDTARETAVHLQFSNGSCSGTIVGPHAVLSATHCFSFGETLRLWQQPVRILQQIDDGNDHTIIIVDRNFPAWAVVGHTPKIGSSIHILGNPGDLTELYRHGYAAGVEDVDGKLCELYDLRGWFGDSGAGIFDDNGHLIGVISLIYTLDDGRGQLTMMGGFPLAFTAEQWGEALRGSPRNFAIGAQNYQVSAK